MAGIQLGPATDNAGQIQPSPVTFTRSHQVTVAGVVLGTVTFTIIVAFDAAGKAFLSDVSADFSTGP